MAKFADLNGATLRKFVALHDRNVSARSGLPFIAGTTRAVRKLRLERVEPLGSKPNFSLDSRLMCVKVSIRSRDFSGGNCHKRKTFMGDLRLSRSRTGSTWQRKDSNN